VKAGVFGTIGKPLATLAEWKERVILTGVQHPSDIPDKIVRKVVAFGCLPIPGKPADGVVKFMRQYEQLARAIVITDSSNLSVDVMLIPAK